MQDEYNEVVATADASGIRIEERPISATEIERTQRVIDHFDAVRYIVERRTDDPFGALWRELERFTGSDASRRVMDQRGIEDDVRNARLRNEVRLGSAFYLSYRDAEEIIDPVLLYYGAYSLAKAICNATLSTRDYKRWQKRPTHGISTKTGSSLLDSKIVFQNNGTAQALAVALGGELPTAGEMDALDVFRAVPELDALLREMNLGGTSAMYVDIVNGGDLGARAFRHREHLHCWIDRETYTNDDFEREIAVFPALAARGLVLQMDSREFAWKTRAGGHADLYLLATSTPDGLFFQRRVSDCYIPEMAVHLILLHLLSDFARYHPDEWIDMTDEHTDEYALVREFINASESKFPNLVLNELTQKNFRFRHY